MTVLAVILVHDPAGVAAARRPVGGRPWLHVLVDRLRRAAAVGRVVVASGGHWEELQQQAATAGVDLIETETLHASVLDALGELAGATFCEITQWFADPSRLDALAATPADDGAHVVTPVLDAQPSLALWGGASLSIVTRAGLIAAARGERAETWQVDRRPVVAEPPELHAPFGADDWPVLAVQAIEARESSAVVTTYQAVRATLPAAPVPLWDGIGFPPRRLLTLRCLRDPMFSDMVRFLAGIPSVHIDVVCARHHADATAALPGVHGVLCFDEPTFSAESLAGPLGRELARRSYDLCLLPRLEPSGHGLANTHCLPSGTTVAATAWMDVRGEVGFIAGAPHAWDPPGPRLAPYLEPLAHRARARSALARFSEPETLAALLPRVDEHLCCHAVLDAPEVGVDLATPLVYQWPISQRLARRLTDLEATRPDVATALAARADAVLARLVDAAVIATPGDTTTATAGALAELEALDATLAAVLDGGTEVP